MTTFTSENFASGNTVANLAANSNYLILSASGTAIDRTTGSNIGDMTAGGGLAAAFDGNTSQISTDCARKLNTATAGWIGKTLAAPSTIDRAIVYGPSDTGLSTSVNVILQLYGKTGAAPASSSDGTLLAQTGFVDDNFVAVPHHLSSNNKTTAWDHLWVILTPRALQSNIHIAEVEFYSEFSGSTSVSAQEIRIGNSSIYAIVNSSAVSVSNSFAVSDSFLTDMQIDNTSGTNIGDMTGSAGLAAAFDGDTLQVATESATITANAGYVGKTLVAATPITKVIVYGPTDVGFAAGNNTIDLYAKTGSLPANSTDGSLLATTGDLPDVAYSNGFPQILTSNDQVTSWNHIWVRNKITSGASAALRISEIEIYTTPIYSNTIVNSSSIFVRTFVANGSTGASGQVLTSNGSVSYWNTLSINFANTANVANFANTANTANTANNSSYLGTIVASSYARLDAADQSLTGGARVTVVNLGNSGTGTITPDPGDGPMQKYTNNGAHTLAPGSNYGTYLLDILNTTGAGAISTSGWSKVAGDSFTVTTTDKFRCHCSVTADQSLIIIQKTT